MKSQLSDRLNEFICEISVYKPQNVFFFVVMETLMPNTSVIQK